MKEKNRKPKSIQLVLFLSMVSFLLLVLGLLWLFQVVFLDEFYSTVKRAQASRVMDHMGDILENSHQENLEEDDLQEQLYILARDADVVALVTDLEGNIYYESGTADRISGIRVLQSVEFQNLFQEAIRKPGALQTLVLENRTLDRAGREGIASPFYSGMPRSGQSILQVVIEENDDDQPLALVVIMEITPVSATVETLKIQLLSVTGLMLVLAMILAFVFSRFIARPIRRITASARDLGKGTFPYEKGSSMIREVDELNDTLHDVDGELMKVEKLRKEFLANVSHDLRTPLTMIKGYSEAMRDIPGENNPENIQVIIDEAERLHSLVQNLLELSKMDEKELQLKIEPYPFTRQVMEIVERYRQMLGGKGYQFEFFFDQEKSVRGDELRLSQVLYNLLNNAVTYTGEDQKIWVRQEILDNKLRLSVGDSGEGIPMEKLDSIWERYNQGEQNHKRAQLGSGLGLSIVKSIIEKHGGAVGAESGPQGSVFWFEVPL